MELGSLSVKDRCGECDGDGSRCARNVDLNNNSLSMSHAIVNKELMERLITLNERKFSP